MPNAECRMPNANAKCKMPNDIKLTRNIDGAMKAEESSAAFPPF
jgi:hypothetical protein